MSSFAPGSAAGARSIQSKGPYFPIDKIPFKPSAGPDELAFKHYDAKQMILGKTMEEHCRFAVCYWHTFRGTGADPFGFPTLIRPWDDCTDSLDNAIRRLHVAFEFFAKLGVKYYTFHDRDIAPEGKDLTETNANLDVIVAEAKKLQAKTRIKCLWGTANLFSNVRYMNGAATNPDAHVVAYAAAQVKKAIEITHELGGENFVFWGGREGYATLLNTDVKRELDHMAAFFKMAIAHARKIGFTGQFLIEPKPKEPSAHQYDYDAQTVIGFLKTYGLDKDMLLNIEPNHTQLAGHRFVHDVHVAAKLGFLGSIDANTGSEDLGWDTDQFIMEINNSTQLMLAVLQMGGFKKGGLNFDCKVRRESTDLLDMFWGHVGSMDALALGLKIAAKMIEENKLGKLVQDRYSSFDSGLGKKIEAGTATFEECAAFINANGEPKPVSGQQEKCEVILNHYINSRL